jgi:hypothetical protein
VRCTRRSSRVASSRPTAPASRFWTRPRRSSTPTGSATAKDLVAHLRSEAGRNPYDRDLSNLIGELSTRSQEFRTWWAAHNVRYHQTGVKRLQHPVVGEIELSYEVMELSADTGLTVAVYSAEPGSRAEQALDLLASWTATPDQVVTPSGDRAREG